MSAIPPEAWLLRSSSEIIRQHGCSSTGGTVLGRIVSDLNPAIQVVTSSLDSDFQATGTGLQDKAESVKAKLGAQLTARIKQFDAFYHACRRAGPDLTDDQFIDMQVEAQRLKDELDKLIASKPSRLTALHWVLILAAITFFALVTASG